MRKIILLLCSLFFYICSAQDISLFRQFNGRYDYTAFGNTLNDEENNSASGCRILTESSAAFQLTADQTPVAAYLYWAGSGIGDFEVTLQGVNITSQRTFSANFNGLPYFAAFADVTDVIQNIGNTNYTLSNLDLLDAIQPYCSSNGGTGTNFGGWAVFVIYEEATLPNNQIIIFDGLEGVSSQNFEINIELNNLNVIDEIGAKIGFLAWEGDQSLAVQETLQINNNTLSNLPLNPADNAFNSTNSYTNNNALYNMDIDFYSIENFINSGDTSANIKLTSGQDFVMINNIITVLSTELPDATIEIIEPLAELECGERSFNLAYTVFNNNSTDVLPANTPIAFYINQTLIGQTSTLNEIEINGSEDGNTNLSIPPNIPQDFILKAVVDDTGNGQGIVNESDEENNEDELPIHLKIFPTIGPLQNLEICDAVGIETFNFLNALTTFDIEDFITFHLTEDDAQNGENEIENTEEFENTENPQTIFIRVANEDCFIVNSFTVEVVECPLPDATIAITNNLNACRQRDLIIDYIVLNTNGTLPLPAQTPIAIYIQDNLIAQSQTQNSIPIGGNENGIITITLNENIPDNFDLKLVVDDIGNSTGIVEELDESNNNFNIQIIFGSTAPITDLEDLVKCDVGFDTARFDLTAQSSTILSANSGVVSYFTSIDEAIENINPIADAEQYQNTSDPQTIYVRLENEICFATASFLISTENCAPFIPQGFSPNADNINDEFEISNLLNIYESFSLKLFTRNGNLIFEGKNEDGFWKGMPNTGLLLNGSIVPVGTYYYVLNLNDQQFPEPFIGFVYVNY